MDETDKKIIKILKRKGRKPITEIAEEVDLTEGAVRYRINKLLEEGIIDRFTVELGREIKAIVLVKTNPKIPTEDISQKIKEISEIQDIYEVSGEYTIICFVVGVSTGEVNQVVEDIRQVEGVTKTETSLVLNELR